MKSNIYVYFVYRKTILFVFCSCILMAAYGSQSSIPSYYNDAPDRPLFGESRPRVSETQYQYFEFYLVDELNM